jgi:MFS family permease
MNDHSVAAPIATAAPASPASVPPQSVAGEWRAGWTAVLASLAGVTFCILHFYSLGVMIAPLTAAYGWSKSDITAAPAILAIINFFSAAPVGRLVRRVGVRRVAIPGFICYCLALAGFGLAGPSLWTWYAHWLLLGFALPFTSNSVWSLVVATRFDRSRGLALAVALCGTGIASAIAPIAVSYATAHFGWSAAYGLLGAAGLVIGLPLIVLLLRDINVAGPSTGVRSRAANPAIPGLYFREALATRQFWILTTASAIIGVGMPTLMVHFVPIGIHDHMNPQAAAAASGLIGVAAIIGRLTTGVLMDTLPGRFVAAVLFMVPALACVLLVNAHGSVLEMSIAALVIGLATGAEFDVLGVLVSRYLGMRDFAAIYGQIVAVFGLGVGFGPVLGSLIYDYFGSYLPLLSGLGIAFFIPAALALFLGKPAYQTV